MKDKYRIRVLTIIAVIFLCVGGTIKTLQNDTFYVIKLGEYIFSHGIDMMDHWCFIPNLTYTYPHWLYDLFVYLIYNHFGFGGVYVSTILFFILLILSIYYIHLNLNKNEFMAFFISLISVFSLTGFATARAQLVSIILFLFEVYFIEKLIHSGKRKYILLLVLDSLFIANIHATTWLFYFVLYLPFFAQQVVYKIGRCKLFGEKILIEKVGYVRELGISFILAFFMGVFTPSKICYTYIFKVMLGDSQSFIVEHAPLVAIWHPCFVVFVLIFILGLISRETKVKLYELFMILGIVLMSFISTRHLAFFYTIGVIYISRLCIQYLTIKKDYTLDILLNFLIHRRIVYFCFIIIVLLFSSYQFMKNQNFDYVDLQEYPVSAVLYIKDHLDVSSIRLYNDYNFGSYLMFHDIPVFVDSRCDLYLKEFNGLDYSIFDDEMNMAKNYEEKFEFYDFTHILISKGDVLYPILSGRLDYQLLYEDQDFILFERVEK